MAITDKIQEGVQQLPTALQAEVLDFVQYLLVKTKRGAQEDEDGFWSEVSLSSAMHGMEDEDSPQYTIADLRVIFS
ncbi:MAG: DUF2281 domain-containing protein [Candidatus Entotheonellia bacterium]